MPLGEGRPLLICASTQYWNEAWFRKHHFMRHLARRRPVCYVEPSNSILRRPGPGRAFSGNPWLRPRLRRADEGPWIWTPPRGFPFWTHAGVSAAQYRRYGAMLRRSARALGFEKTWLWLYNPLYVQAIPTLRPERLIFDLVDDLGAYVASAHTRRTMQRCVSEAIEKADLLLTTSRLLAGDHEALARGRTIHVIPNGVRGEWIDRTGSHVPEDLRGLPRPLIGFAGALFGYLDYEILRACARAFPEGTLVLLGRIQDTESVASLAREPNVRVLGSREQETVADYVAAFDVCLCPFREGAVRRAVNPLKVYEYLALGRPVVATPLESLEGEPVARMIRFARDPAEFVAAVRAEIDGDGPEARAARRESARGYTWEALSARVEEVLEQAERRWESQVGDP